MQLLSILPIAALAGTSLAVHWNVTLYTDTECTEYKWSYAGNQRLRFPMIGFSMERAAVPVITFTLTGARDAGLRVRDSSLSRFTRRQAEVMVPNVEKIK
ncbi:hypothetical protein CBS147346_4028 [Aspergillus niger]|nr:hypothetical protein CBS147346_4028 [Aspergillus niger]